MPGPSTAWSGFLADASALASTASVATYADRRGEWYADVLGPLVVADTRLTEVPDDVPVAVVLTGGAGAISGVAALAVRRRLRLTELVVAVRDPDDPAGNVRRIHAAVDAARAEGGLTETAVYVELPPTPPTPSWLAAADAVAEGEAHFSLRAGGDSAGFAAPLVLAGWIDAALDRESSYRCTGGLDRAVRHRDEETGAEEHGFLNLLLATRLAFDGAPVADVAELLDDRYADDLVALARTSDLTGARRWLTSFDSTMVDRSLDDLLDLGLLEAPEGGSSA